MTRLPAREPAYSPYAALRERCRALGLPTWRCDTGGAIVSEPSEPGLASLWLRSHEITAHVARTVQDWIGQAQPEIVSPFPGCWLIPVLEENRRRQSGLLIVMALGAEASSGPVFEAACRAAQLDAQAARSTFKRLARFDETSAQHIARMLALMVKDLSALGEYQDAVDGFTGELTQSYETIDLLYALGRSMLELNNPGRFAELVCSRLHEAMQFGWLGARFVNEPRLSNALAGRAFLRCAEGVAAPAFDRLCDAVLERSRAELRAYILSEHAADLGIAGQVLIQPILRDGRPAGLLVAGDKAGDDPQVNSYDMQLMEAAGAFLGAFLENAGLYADQQAMFLGSLKALTASIDAKDRYTCGHSERVALLAARLALAVGLSQEQADRVHICGLVHDVGKIGVPESVLSKPGRLTEEEFALVRLHPEIGHRILKDIPLLEDILSGVLSHHERWDGGGYPHGLVAEQIPVVARLIGLADTFDAMSSTRSYRAAVSREKVLSEILACAGTQFDPRLAAAFVGLDLSEYDRMVARHAREHEAHVGKAAA